VATAMMTCGAFTGPVLSGYIHDKTHSYNLAVLLALVLVSISVTLVLLLKRIPVSELQ
jgi:cyanate permease